MVSPRCTAALVRRVEIIHLDGDVRYYGRMSVVRHDADLQ